MPPTPSSIISDALNSLSKATNIALATVEDQARSDVARANAEASETRRERDDALKQLHALRIEERDWERREEAWKAALDKAELTIKHHNETIAHLRAETHQWKAQLSRLEETSRQEIADWKEQYLHAEQDRCHLSSRINELVAEQLAWNTQVNAGVVATTQKTPYPDFYDSSTSSTTTKRASTLSAVPSLHKQQTPLLSAQPGDEPQSQPRKSRPAQTPSKAAPNAVKAVAPTPSRASQIQTRVNEPSGPTSKTLRTSQAPHLSTTRMTPGSRSKQQAEAQPLQQRVIRRVQAIISVPVKEEEDSEGEGLESEASGSAYEPDEEQPIRRKRAGRMSVSAKEKQARAWREEDDGEDDEEQPVHGRAPRRARHIQADDSDVDELAMGIGDDEEYGQAIVARNSPQKNARKDTSGRPSLGSKKRKLDTGTTPGSRGTTTKVARKK
ncbi:hypothetical protein POSPLADRAFT_1070933 [Postia placenta MAD-698-R-SB12]|uniref:Uncharacterized protein n=1 Tax=Postia placenta MAD-698-R-SB12 TaxID=670580 RepID=A0A1X6MU90_9APHY|nr:hypothetical protein POSPLADRAFT_1070933 [Postia placenta MAD-698-R-SB12]OSX59954.1 hypothetical protein POSPLADRAFT_1070933 [Postia placenta MAD-698-R-SB12]